MDVSEQGLNSFFEHVPVVVYRCIQKGLDRKFQFVSPHIHVLLGLTPEQLLLDSRAFFRRIHPEDRNKFLRAWAEQATLPALICVEYRILTEENRVIWIQEHSVLSQDEQGEGKACQGVLLEIPNYQVVQDELRRWEQELQSLTENLPDIIGRIDHKNRILYLNRWWDSLEYFPPEKYLGKRLKDLGLSQKVADIFEMKIANVLESGMPATFEISHPTFKGMKNFEVRFCPEPAIGKRILTVLMICRDITDVRTAELAFKESDEKFLQLAEAIDSVFWMWDVELQRIVYVSPAYERLWGGNAQKLMNNPFDWLSIVLPEDRARVENLFLKRLDGASLDIEYRVIGPNEEIRWVHNRTYPLNDGSGKISRIIGLAQDVTERKKWEEERMRGAKLESLGLLAGGLAHDFNNLLTAILGQLSLAKYEVDTAHPLFSRLAEAEQASLRAQDIAQQLLTFSKGGEPVKNVESLENILEENVRLVLAGSKVRPVFRGIQGLWAVNVDLGQICQVLHNLVINARQAMENGGECLVEASNVSKEEGERLSHSHQLVSSQDQWIRVTVQDQGIGISKENLVKVFDPYFTTKSTGSGLGLATSYSIIRNHGGVLWAESEVGVGSRFSFLLPALSPEKVDPPPIEKEIKIGHGNILIMDDEVQIRKVLGEMVQTCGYSFQAVPDGEQALHMFRQAQSGGEPFSAVILDLTIPGGFGGKEVVKEMLSLDPHLRAIVVSGYSNDPVLANYEDYGFKGRVAKPFNLVDLSIVLDSVIEETVL
jgi:PAS domain S-box-containing protein